jgi:hypothetical protein
MHGTNMQMLYSESAACKNEAALKIMRVELMRADALAAYARGLVGFC